ncbi:sulfoxide reductase heme-binding subunit YedZ [Thioalbus denitrificans]|uniref:Protein-methionine-sulfoxide reductase heme-binding subunit MsrQ n=1 Tax=Thioalbus denitrificans TaxID=547122 RepID=A0A369CH08_9GAMM|nr:sulfoxide reductase heme-binding subunit YedZ [Thioalbus denitrificans]
MGEWTWGKTSEADNRHHAFTHSRIHAFTHFPLKPNPTPTRRVPPRWLKPAVFALCLLPLALLAWRAVSGGLGANPIEAFIRHNGDWALRLLLLTLAVTPLRRLTGWTWPLRVRRMIGLFAFFYATLHLLGYVGLDQFFDWPAIGADILKRPYITIGMSAFALLVPLAATSTDAMLRRLGGRRWQRLHRLAYLAAGAGVLHFLWLVKADLREPLLYAAILLLLLGFRLVRFLRRVHGARHPA